MIPHVCQFMVLITIFFLSKTTILFCVRNEYYTISNNFETFYQYKLVQEYSVPTFEPNTVIGARLETLFEQPMPLHEWITIFIAAQRERERERERLRCNVEFFPKINKNVKFSYNFLGTEY